jgi:radical SAM superfamily enzyme YgiQ (UPF0313 family)
MKILLIYPSRLDDSDRVIKYRKAFTPPLSLGILSGLTPERHDVRIINDLVEPVDFDAPVDLVGITALTSQADRAYQICAGFREKGVKTVIGGVHPSLMPEEAIQHADTVVIGEAEGIWPRILSDAENNSLQPIYNNSTFDDLSCAVKPRWDRMNLGVYRRSPGRKFPRIPIYTTRGCVHNCSYCSVTKFFGRTYRFRPVAQVCDEIDYTGAESYFFVDDNICCNPDYSRELFTALQNRKISWFSQASTTILNTPELIPMMSKAGCRHLFLGVETLDRQSLLQVKKGFNRPEKYKELLERLLEVNIQPWCSIILNLADATQDSFEKTVSYLKSCGVGNIVIWILTPLPGTDLYDQFEKEGRIIDRRWSHYDLNHVVYQPKNFQAKELIEYYWKSYKKIYGLNQIVKHVTGYANPVKVGLPSAIKTIAGQLYFRKQVNHREHPFAMGLNRLGTLQG